MIAFLTQVVALQCIIIILYVHRRAIVPVNSGYTLRVTVDDGNGPEEVESICSWCRFWVCVYSHALMSQPLLYIHSIAGIVNWNISSLNFWGDGYAYLKIVYTKYFRH